MHCGIQAAAVLVGLAVNAAVGAWWRNPLIGLCIAGREAWHGDGCA